MPIQTLFGPPPPPGVFERLQEAVSSTKENLAGRLEEAFEHGREDEYLLPLDEALLDWPALVVGGDDARRIGQGQAVPGVPPVAEGSEALCRAYSPDGDFLAILTYDAAAEHWQPKKVFAPT